MCKVTTPQSRNLTNLSIIRKGQERTAGLRSREYDQQLIRLDVVRSTFSRVTTFSSRDSYIALGYLENHVEKNYIPLIIMIERGFSFYITTIKLIKYFLLTKFNFYIIFYVQLCLSCGASFPPLDAGGPRRASSFALDTSHSQDILPGNILAPGTDGVIWIVPDHRQSISRRLRRPFPILLYARFINTICYLQNPIEKNIPLYHRI